MIWCGSPLGGVPQYIRANFFHYQDVDHTYEQTAMTVAATAHIGLHVRVDVRSRRYGANSQRMNRIDHRSHFSWARVT